MKKCKMCGSKFDLTRHHVYKGTNLPRNKQKVVILCKTCHYNEDFGKNLACYTNALFKRYDEKMDKLTQQQQTHNEREEKRYLRYLKKKKKK